MASTTVIAVPSDGTPNWLLLDGSVTEEDEEFSHGCEVPTNLVPASTTEIMTIEKMG